jgi:hypothetical protein
VAFWKASVFSPPADMLCTVMPPSLKNWWSVMGVSKLTLLRNTCLAGP